MYRLRRVITSVILVITIIIRHRQTEIDRVFHCGYLYIALLYNIYQNALSESVYSYDDNLYYNYLKHDIRMTVGVRNGPTARNLKFTDRHRGPFARLMRTSSAYTSMTCEYTPIYT